MLKRCLPILLFCAVFLTVTPAHAESANWCGAYFEEDNIGYLRIAMSDIRNGSASCTVENYRMRAQVSGTANIALGFTKNRSMVANWRKFNNHVLEVRGKLKNGEITYPRFVRDLGV